MLVWLANDVFALYVNASQYYDKSQIRATFFRAYHQHRKIETTSFMMVLSLLEGCCC